MADSCIRYDRGAGGGYGGGARGGFGGGGGDRMSNLGAGLKSQDWDMATMPKFEKSFCKHLSRRCYSCES